MTKFGELIDVNTPVLLEVVSARDSDSLDPIAVTVRDKGWDPS